ncbi:carboxylesterase/lipase family protein [Spelaeicoccus albus]|uniref:Carboxylic ester hydrolase n=1 Tax=Spelaeicoccus albus TaxID=1280376 RepID=A0A7Z0IIT2_9MICO|nr:carboxylesterase family protein [Spelaeicoccus albus]NYI68692.1 para-nitrobenzyl esterase [Spelaeicoccus albus]
MKTEVSTHRGRVAGLRDNGIVSFRGIPYAAAPTGRRRFAAPVGHAGWVGVRDATRFGATCTRRPYSGALGAILPDPVIAGDDTLNVNVWAPADAEPGSLPVLVWFHGGSLVHGSNAVPIYDGTAFAASGIVFVSVNYRLGVDGFGQLPDAPANRGLLDQLAALQWVQVNIGAFGGDHDRVTIAGESAGAYSVAALMATPLGAGLFHRAVMQSGPTAAASSDHAAAVTERLAGILGVPRTAAALSEIDLPTLDDAQEELLADGSPLTGGPAFTFVVDGHSLPEGPDRLLAKGAGGAVPLLLGTNRDEYRLWTVPGGRTGTVSEAALARSAEQLGVPDAVLHRYRDRPDNSPGEILGRIASDRLLWLPTMRLARARRKNRSAATFMYQFNWPAGELGACHALELPFVFGTHRAASSLVGADAPDDLHRAMHGAWVDFINSADPGWAPWSADQPTMVFDSPVSDVTDGPRAADFEAYGDWR